jgi:hypothetical protein
MRTKEEDMPLWLTALIALAAALCLHLAVPMAAKEGGVRQSYFVALGVVVATGTAHLLLGWVPLVGFLCVAVVYVSSILIAYRLSVKSAVGVAATSGALGAVVLLGGVATTIIPL